ncbi:YceI family protein [Rubrivivax sp. A210]|uniref:YceI family protein n=1 Tax=Rubrivivax sp. A210 TaxID=2772301 RepID=UPI001F2A0AC6|nr:YceI family protein [Rubrivivax sp. A210]
MLLSVACVAPPAPAEPAIYTLDPAHSWVTFEVMHFATSTIRGRIGPVQGQVTLDRAAGRGEVSLVIPTATVDAGFPFFNARLRQADLLASAEFPDAYFVATRFRFESGRVAEVRGEFTLRGVSQPLSLVAAHYACRNDEQGAEVCGGDFEGEVLRSEFGASFGLPLVGDRVRLRVQVEGRRRP